MPLPAGAKSSQRRIVSDSSIADPSQDSGEGVTIYSAKEKECDSFANLFSSETIELLWPDTGLELDWPTGRRHKPKLEWSEGYPFSPSTD